MNETFIDFEMKSKTHRQSTGKFTWFGSLHNIYKCILFRNHANAIQTNQ